MSSLPVDGRLTVVEEADRVLVVREDDPTDWLCSFAKAGGFPAERWAQDMARTYNARLELRVNWLAHNETGGNASNYMQQIEPAYSLYERLGVPGVKTGYAGDTTVDGVKHNHYDQVMVNHYRETIRRAARHHLVLEGTRWSRTPASGERTRTS